MKSETEAFFFVVQIPWCLCVCMCVGYQTALSLSRQGAHVILACRNSRKAEDAVSRMRRAHVCVCVRGVCVCVCVVRP